MEVIVIESQAFYKLQEKLIGMFSEALKQATKAPDDWISPEEAKKLLGVKSKSKMQQLRDTNAIKFSQHGRKHIKYSRISILEYLKRNIPAY